MKASDNPGVGRWRIIGADLWDREHLDLCGPASLVVRANGDGEIAFGAMQASLDVDYGPDEIGFTWAGFDERWTRSQAGDPPSFRKTAHSKSSSSTILATKPPSEPFAILLQKPAS